MNYLHLEAQLLHLCLKAVVTPNTNEDAINSILKKNINWPYFLKLTLYNRVIPVVWQCLKNHKNIPNGISIYFQAVINKLITHRLCRIQEFKYLLELLKCEQIPAIPFKGPVLGKYYDNPILREWSDTDIIVQKDDIVKVFDLLLANGYYCSNVKSLKELLNTSHSCNFYNKDSGSEVDIHWCFSDSYEGINYPMEQIWKRQTIEPFFDIQSPMLCPEDLILTTCLHHGLRNNWRELRFIFDFATLLNFHKELKWQKILVAANCLGMQRALLVGVSLANLFFQIEIPFQVRNAISENKTIEKIRRLICKGMFTNYNTFRRVLSDFRIKLKMRENLHAKLALFKHEFLPYLKPNGEDEKIITLPSFLHFAYYIIRPFRILWIYILSSPEGLSRIEMKPADSGVGVHHQL